MSFLPFFTTTVANPANPNEVKVPELVPFWSQPSTRWDIFKFLLPSVIAIVWSMVSMWFRLENVIQGQAELRATISRSQDTDTSRGERLIVVETKVDALGKDTTEMKGDVKTLLARSAH